MVCTVVSVSYLDYSQTFAIFEDTDYSFWYFVCTWTIRSLDDRWASRNIKPAKINERNTWYRKCFFFHFICLLYLIWHNISLFSYPHITVKSFWEQNCTEEDQRLSDLTKTHKSEMSGHVYICFLSLWFAVSILLSWSFSPHTHAVKWHCSVVAFHCSDYLHLRSLQCADRQRVEEPKHLLQKL